MTVPGGRHAAVRPDGPGDCSRGWSESAAGGRSGTPGRRRTARAPTGRGKRRASRRPQISLAPSGLRSCWRSTGGSSAFVPRQARDCGGQRPRLFSFAPSGLNRTGLGRGRRPDGAEENRLGQGTPTRWGWGEPAWAGDADPLGLGRTGLDRGRRPDGPGDCSRGWSESAAGGRSGTPGRRRTAPSPDGAREAPSQPSSPISLAPSGLRSCWRSTGGSSAFVPRQARDCGGQRPRLFSFAPSGLNRTGVDRGRRAIGAEENRLGQGTPTRWGWGESAWAGDADPLGLKRTGLGRGRRPDGPGDCSRG